MPLTINGESVDEGLLEAEFGQIKAHFEQQANVSCCERDDEFMGYAKENVIARVLLAQAAADQIAPPADADIDAKLAELKDEYGGEASFHAQVGDDHDAIREEIAKGLRIDRLVETLAPAAPEPGEDELRRYYDDHADAFMTAEEVRAMHIFKSLQMAEHKEESFRDLCEARRRAVAGEDFMALVREHSDKPEDEADLGWFRRGELMDEFELVAFSMEVGEVSPVFATQWGMHLARLTDRKPPRPVPLEEVADEIRGRIAAEARDAALSEFIDGLKAEAEIVDRDEGDEHEEDPG